MKINHGRIFICSMENFEPGNDVKVSERSESCGSAIRIQAQDSLSPVEPEPISQPDPGPSRSGIPELPLRIEPLLL